MFLACYMKYIIEAFNGCYISKHLQKRSLLCLKMEKGTSNRGCSEDQCFKHSDRCGGARPFVKHHVIMYVISWWLYGKHCLTVRNIVCAISMHDNCRLSMSLICYLKMTFRRKQHFTLEPWGLDSPQQDLPRSSLCLQGRTSVPWVEWRWIADSSLTT